MIPEPDALDEVGNFVMAELENLPLADLDRLIQRVSDAEDKAKRAIGIHWGTFEGISDEPIDQAPKDLEIAKSTSSVPMDFFVLKHGQSWVKPSQ